MLLHGTQGKWACTEAILDVDSLYVWLNIAAIQAQLEAPPTEFEPRPEAELGWRRYLPVRQMTAEEWARYQTRKDLQFQDRCATLPAWGLDILGAIPAQAPPDYQAVEVLLYHANSIARMLKTPRRLFMGQEVHHISFDKRS